MLQFGIKYRILGLKKMQTKSCHRGQTLNHARQYCTFNEMEPCRQKLLFKASSKFQLVKVAQDSELFLPCPGKTGRQQSIGSRFPIQELYISRHINTELAPSVMHPKRGSETWPGCPQEDAPSFPHGAGEGGS